MPIRLDPQPIPRHLLTLVLVAVILVAIGYQWRAPMTIQMDRDSDVYSSGFYPYPGQTEGVDSRWTDGDGSVRVPNIGLAAPVVLNIKTRAWRDATRVFTTTVTVNGFPIGVISKANWRDWSFTISDPTILRADELIVGFQTAPWILSEVFLGSIDHRQVGLEVASVEVGPQWGNAVQTWNVFTLPSLAQLLFGMFLAVGTFLLCLALGISERRAFTAGLVAAVCFAVCVAFFRLASSHYGAIGAIALAAIIALAWLSDSNLIVSRAREYVSRQAIVATAVFCILAVFVCFVLVERIGQSVLGMGPPNDNFYFLWQVGWIQKSLLQLRSPFAVSFLNFPEGWNLAYNDITPAMNLIALPVSFVGGPVFGYNFCLLVSIVLSGLGMYVWTRCLTNSPAAGLIAGTIFAFLPYHTGHMLEHLNLSGTQWFPFYFMSLGELYRPARSGKWAAMAGIFLGLLAMTTAYYLLMTAVMTLIFVGGHFLLVDRKLLSSGIFWRRILTVALVAAPIVSVAIAPYAQVAAQGNYIQHPYFFASYNSASPTDFLLPAPTHFIWGNWIQKYFDGKDPVEFSLYVGLVALCLAVVGFVRRCHIPHLTGAVKLFAFSAICAFVLALGPDLHWMGQSVTIAVPQVLQRWYPYPQSLVTLPGYWLYRFLPLYSSMRGSVRFAIFVGLFVSILAGIGAAWLIGNTRPRFAILATLGLILLVLFDFYWGTPPYMVAQARPIDYWFAAQPDEGAVAEFPESRMEDSAGPFYADVRNKPFVGANFFAYPSPQLMKIRPAMNSFPSETSVAQLKDLGIRWVIVDSDQFADFDQTKAAIENLGLRFVAQLDGQYAYELR